MKESLFETGRQPFAKTHPNAVDRDQTYFFQHRFGRKKSAAPIAFGDGETRLAAPWRRQFGRIPGQSSGATCREESCIVIIGIGIDVAEVSRYAFDETKLARFAKKVFTEAEMAHAMKHRHFAAPPAGGGVGGQDKHQRVSP